MTSVRTAAAIGGVGLAAVALLFGVTADPAAVAPALVASLRGTPPAPVVARDAPVMTTDFPKGSVIDREVDFARTISVPAPDVPPAVARAKAAEQAAFAAAAAEAAAANGLPAPAVTVDPAATASAAPKAVDWSNGPKPGEPMLDPTPR